MEVVRARTLAPQNEHLLSSATLKHRNRIGKPGLRKLSTLKTPSFLYFSRPLSGANLAMCCRKLSTFKPKPPLIPPIYSRQYSFNPKSSITKISLECRIIEEEPTYINTNRHYGTCVSLLNHPNPEISCFYQKGFSQITKEVTGKALHALCIKGLVNSTVFYSNTLINMYSKFGHIGLSRYLFDKMSDRNEASWNNMMSGFVRAGFYRESMRFFNEMRGFGVKPSGIAFASLVTACERSEWMRIEGVQVHGFIVKVGLLSDVFVGTPACAFIWELWIGCRCNEGCGSVDNLKWGRGIHSLVLKFGWNSNVCTSNTLITMYSDAGRCEDAESVFQGMVEKDMISWNSMMACYAQDGNCLDALKLLCTMFLHEKRSIM
ncbi:hypothetical protein OIU84_029727 [Salix udensis]|uniref:Pentatricopeptide repeat-containing protein n=1 Tax=Salix udensis TaxID=889485 RepID=A0AAD6KCB4_9ROSI|nr:hypothetical protein OIU84_029727 [Salix udensis]